MPVLRFLHRYSREIGWPVWMVKKMMSSADISEAMVYEKIDPFQSQKIDYWAKCIMALLVNINASRGNAVNPSRFAPPWEAQPKRETLEDQVKKAFGIADKEV